MTFSIVLPAERVRVSPALTTCAAALPRLMVDGAGGGGREVERVDPAAGLVDRVAAQGIVGVEAVGVVAGPAGQRVVAAAALDRVVGPVALQGVAREGVAQAPPMTFSIVLPAERVRVSPALTTCAAALPRLMFTARVVVAEKSSVSTPAAGLVDRVAAQGVVGVEAVGVVAGPAGQRVVAAAPLERVVAAAAVERRCSDRCR